MEKVRKRKPGGGRKSGEPTSLLNFRIPKDLKQAAKSKYEGSLNRMFIQWLKSIV